MCNYFYYRLSLRVDNSLLSDMIILFDYIDYDYLIDLTLIVYDYKEIYFLFMFNSYDLILINY